MLECHWGPTDIISSGAGSDLSAPKHGLLLPACSPVSFFHCSAEQGEPGTLNIIQTMLSAVPCDSLKTATVLDLKQTVFHLARGRRVLTVLFPPRIIKSVTRLPLIHTENLVVEAFSFQTETGGAFLSSKQFCFLPAKETE